MDEHTWEQEQALESRNEHWEQENKQGENVCWQAQVRYKGHE